MKRSLHQVFMAMTLVSAAFFSQAAETQPSTWQHIKQTGELRIGVAQGEPWYFKNPSTGEWDGIGYNIGKELANDLGVKLVTVVKPPGVTRLLPYKRVRSIPCWYSIRRKSGKSSRFS